jgi:HAE1 family hydrophobic/amphiphilic exporter-1
MNLPKFSVQRPIFTTMVVLIIVILGIVSLSRLRIDMLPNIELPTLSIRTKYEGASPEVMERLITQIIEEIVATVPGVETMTSESYEGNSNVRVSFAWGTNIDTAALDLQATIENEINELPDDIVRPRIRKFDINSFPVVLLGISSKLDPVELTQFIEDQIRYRFARIPGVAQVDVWGGFDREIRIELYHEKVNALGLSMSEILQAIRDSNLDLPTGNIEQGRYEIMLRTPAEFKTVDQIKNTVIKIHHGAAVILGQIADIKDTYEKPSRIIRINGERGIRIAIRKQAYANTVEVAQGILSEIDSANSAFPQIKIVPVINQGNFIERSIKNVARSVMYGGGLAVIVLLFFLRNIRSTIVISLSIPISIIATFTLIYFGGFTLNLMTLGGMALGVGMMVDNSIVVLENIFRNKNENNMSSEVASVEGTREVGAAIIASTITTLVIFLPLIFVRGVSGILFKELAYVIIFALICSLLVSFTLVPMLASRLLKPSQQYKDSQDSFIRKLTHRAEQFFIQLDHTYYIFLRQVLRYRLTTIAVVILIFTSSLLLLPLIGSEFLPPSDEGEVRVSGEMEIGTRLGLIDQQTRSIEKIVYAAVPEMISSVTSVRGTRTSSGDIRLSLSPSSERERSNTEIAKDLKARLSGNIPGMKIKTRAPQGQFLLERLLNSDDGLTLEIRGFDLDTLRLLAEKAADMIKDVQGITDVNISNESGMPQEEIHIDRKKAADMGVSIRDITKMLETSIAGSKAGEYRANGNSYRILVQLKDAEKRSMDEILDLTLASDSGEQVALRNIVTPQKSIGAVIIHRKDQQRLMTVTANILGRDIGSIALDVQYLLNQIPRPVGYTLIVAGTYEEQQKAFQELIVSLALALLLVYMVLACQYESFRDPLVVMFSVPLAAIGVLLTLYLTRTTLNLQSCIGCIMLGGIVVNNAILLVDQSGQLNRKGLTVIDAVIEAGRRRLRPILMTTLTTILGLIPLAMGIGEGAEAQAPLARAVVGGLTASTLITLLLIPVIYTYFHPEPETREQ